MGEMIHIKGRKWKEKKGLHSMTGENEMEERRTAMGMLKVSLSSKETGRRSRGGEVALDSENWEQLHRRKLGI